LLGRPIIPAARRGTWDHGVAYERSIIETRGTTTMLHRIRSLLPVLVAAGSLAAFGAAPAGAAEEPTQCPGKVVGPAYDDLVDDTLDEFPTEDLTHPITDGTVEPALCTFAP